MQETQVYIGLSARQLFTDEDPVFGRPIVINMDRDTDRWNDICEHLAQWNITPERLPAVSGVTLPGLPPSMDAPYIANVNLSHAAAIRHCYFNSDRKFWLVLEDDCRFVSDPRKAVFDIMRTVAENNIDWSVMSLGCYSYDWQGPREDFDYSQPAVLNQPIGWFPWGAHSYLVNRKYAFHLVSRLSACLCPSDHVLLEEYRDKRGYLRRPSVAYQEEYLSYHNGNGGGTMETIKSADMHSDLIEDILNARVELSHK